MTEPKDELTEEIFELKKPGESKNPWKYVSFALGAILITAGLFDVFAGSSDHGLKRMTQEAVSTIFGGGRTEVVVEKIDLNNKNLRKTNGNGISRSEKSPNIEKNSSSASLSFPIRQPSPEAGGQAHILINEIMTGTDTNPGHEFIELYNPTSAAVDLTGWFIRKKSSSGNESALLSASRLNKKSIAPGKYFLITNAAYTELIADATWAASYSLAQSNNSIILYDKNGIIIDNVSWKEIPKNESYKRSSWDSSVFMVDSNPIPQNSNSYHSPGSGN